MNIDLTGRLALVTGAGRGIGTAIAAQLAASGADVVLADIDGAAAEHQAAALAGSGPGRIIGGALDITDEDAVASFLGGITSKIGPVQILVNNAGISRPAATIDTALDAWDEVLRVNLTGAFLCSKHCIASMRANGWGRMVTIASFASKSSPIYADNASYAAAKSGLVGLIHNLAIELATQGITVNGIAPGIVNTELLRSAHSEQRRAELVARVPIGRFATPEEVGALAVFLASDLAGSITGEIVNINGGMYLD